MKYLPKIDLKEKYRKCFNFKNRYRHTGLNLSNLFLNLEKESNPVVFREQLMKIIQLYYDNLIEENLGKWSEQEPILNKLYQAGKTFAGQFYRAEDIDFEKIIEIILPFASKIVKSSKKCNVAKKRHLSMWQDAIEDIQKSGLYISSFFKDKSLDSIICVVSGGFEPSFLAMDILELNELIALRYSKFSRNDRKVVLPKKSPRNFLKSKLKNKKVLVVEDIVTTGMSLCKVIQSLLKVSLNKIYACSVMNGEGATCLSDNLDIKNLKNYSPLFFECFGEAEVLIS